MIITRAPFRVSFCGGGSDLPSFYEKYGGCVLSTTIRKYMYLTIHKYFEKNQIVLKYSKTEIVNDYSEIEHRIFKQCLSDFDLKGVELSSMADIPAGTGLGSSSTFTVALLHLLNTYTGQYVSKYKLAKDACAVEIEKLGEPIGKQDQFAAAFGGLKFYEFMPNGFVNVEPVIMKPESYSKLEKNLLMFYLGGTHALFLLDCLSNANRVYVKNNFIYGYECSNESVTGRYKKDFQKYQIDEYNAMKMRFKKYELDVNKVAIEFWHKGEKDYIKNELKLSRNILTVSDRTYKWMNEHPEINRYLCMEDENDGIRSKIRTYMLKLNLKRLVSIIDVTILQHKMFDKKDTV